MEKRLLNIDSEPSARFACSAFSRCTFVVALIVAWGSPSWACQAPDGRTKAAETWQVVEVGPDYETPGLDDMVGETYFYAIARSPAFPGLEVPLPAYSWAAGQVFDWVTLERYDHKIGLLQYSGGSAGTSVSVVFINNVVVDLVHKKALGAANVLTTDFSDLCRESEWIWSDTGLQVHDEVLSDRLEFNFDFGSGPKRFLDD